MDIQEYIQSGAIESYVLGLATEEEVNELDSLRKDYPEIEVAIHQFSVALEKQAFDHAITPSAHVRQKIMAAINVENSKPNTTIPKLTTSIPNEKPTAKVYNFSFWRNVAAASVILFLISGMLNLFLYDKYNKKNQDYQALLSEKKGLLADNGIIQANLKEWKSAAEMMVDTGMVMVKMNAVPGKENNKAMVFWDNKTKDVYVMINKLPPPQPGKQYQLWALMDGKPIDAGVISDCSTTCKMKNIANAQAFAITLENTGGSPTPNLQAMYVFGKV